jgi:hypothetical protein
MKLSRTVGLAAATCIITLMVTAAGAAGMPGPAGHGWRNSTPQGTSGTQAYSMSQTLSDQAQQMTIAFDALAFMTGDACSDTFLPPGKVADYAGFQYLRDNDRTQMGHNTDFVTRASDNVLVTLNDQQLAQFVALSKQESTLSSRYALMRFPLMTAFRDQYAGAIPSGSSGLDKAAVMAYSGHLYEVDANISIARAKTYASVINSLNQTQRTYLDTMKSGGMLSWPAADSSEVLKKSGQGNSVAMRTYASEMFSWYAGSVDADVYFCPERQATYFGSFYMKDRPAMGNAGYSISTSLTGNSGEEFLSLLTSSQREKIAGLVDIQRADLDEIVTTRTAIATELRRPLTGGTIDEEVVRTLSARYGALDGGISYYYATRFAEVGASLTSEQKQKMIALRNLSSYTCQGAYLYSRTISMPEDVPTDFLFGIGTYNTTAMTAWLREQQEAASRSRSTGEPVQGRGPGGKTSTTGNSTSLSQGPGSRGDHGHGTAPGGGNSTSPDQGQERRMPVDMIITQLGEKGYTITGAAAAIRSGDREAQKAWLETFRKENPGVAEAIEAAWTGFDRSGNSGSEHPAPGQQAGGQAPLPEKGNSNSTDGWFGGVWRSLWGGAPRSAGQ